MAKRFRKAKRTFRKKRFMRKRSRKSALPRYDGMVRVKMTADKQTVVLDGFGNSAMIIDWGNQIDAPAAGAIRIQDTPEWDRYSSLYRYFRIQGVKMRWLPYQFNSGAAQIISEELAVGSSAVGSALDPTVIKLAVDYKVQQTSRQMFKYVGVAKSRRKNTGGSGDTSPWMDVESILEYHDGHTGFFSQVNGNPVGFANGIFFVTYYVWFKGQRTDV